MDAVASVRQRPAERTKKIMGWIYPTTAWQTMEIKNMSANPHSVDTKEFYVGVRVVDAITVH